MEKGERTMGTDALGVTERKMDCGCKVWTFDGGQIHGADLCVEHTEILDALIRLAKINETELVKRIADYWYSKHPEDSLEDLRNYMALGAEAHRVVYRRENDGS